jgi:hypothetical protein
VNPDDLRFDGNCNTVQVPWSILVSSSSSANLAAVLAAFMMTAIALLLRREGKENETNVEPAPAHTLALFASGVLVLLLDAYLFGSIAATRPPVNGGFIRQGGEYICAIVWTQGMAASGMLAVGGTLMIAGLGWMLTQYAKSSNVHSAFFATLGDLLTLVVVGTTSVPLITTSTEFINVISLKFGFVAPPYTYPAIEWVGGLSASISCLMILLRAVAIFRRRRHHKKWDTEELTPRFKTLATASLLTAALAFAGPFFAALIGEQPNPPGTAAVWIAVSLCVGLPSLIYLAIGYAAPGPDFRHSFKRYPPARAHTLQSGGATAG